MVNLHDLINRFLTNLWHSLVCMAAMYILIPTLLLGIVVDIFRAFWYENDYDNNDNEYVNPSLDILPLSDKFIESRERILQVYLIVFGLFTSNYYTVLEHSTGQEVGIFSLYYLKYCFVISLCSALIYYILLSKPITYLLRRFMCFLACVMGLLFGIMLLQMLDIPLNSNYSLVLFSVVSLLITFSLLI